MAFYNVKIYHYVNGEQQFRIYTRAIYKNEKVENKDFDIKTDKLDLNNIKSDKLDLIDQERSQNNSVNRTINKIYEITRSNLWEYFVTFTFSPDICDRFNYDDVTKVFHQWIDRIKKTLSPNLKYIFVPEKHKSGAFHFHGLISNIGEMKLINSGHKSKGKIIYNIDSFNLGFTTATKVSDTSKVSNYITKYITKELLNVSKNKKRYWHSNNLDTPLIEEIEMLSDDVEILIDSLHGRIKYTKGIKCGPNNNVLYIEVKNM